MFKYFIVLINVLLFIAFSGFAENIIEYKTEKDFNKCNIINGRIQYFNQMGYGIVFDYKKNKIDEATDLFLDFENQQVDNDITGNYHIKLFNVKFNSDMKFNNTFTGGFINSDNQIIIKVTKNNFLANSVDLGSFAIDFFLYPLLVNPKNIILEKGIYYDDKYYGIRIMLKNRTLNINFENLFYDDQGHSYTISFNTVKRFALNQWQHIGIKYNRTNGKISVYFNGDIDTENFAIAPNGSILIPHFSQFDGSDLILFQGFYGYVDNFRIMRTVMINYREYCQALNNYLEITSPLIDLKYVYPKINEVSFKVKKLNVCSPKVFIQNGNKKNDFIQQDWHILTNYSQYNDEIKVTSLSNCRYLKWKLIIMKSDLPEPPVLYSFKIKYNENTPSLAPKNIKLEIISSGSIKISWSPNFEDNVKGYIIYWGNESHTYDNKIDVGLKNSYIIDSLAPDQNYYFTIKAYNSSNPYNLSAFSKEERIYLK